MPITRILGRRARLALLLAALALGACTEVVDYRVANRAIANYTPTPQNALERVHIIERNMLSSEVPMPALPHTERVRLTLPSYGVGNAYLSVGSAWEESSPSVRVLVEFEGRREVDFKDANISYKGARLHIPCAGWSVEIDGQPYPLEPGFCSGEMRLGDERYGSAMLRFKAPKGPFKQFTVQSPPWVMDDGLLHALPESERVRFKVQPPAITFERKVERKLAIQFSIH